MANLGQAVDPRLLRLDVSASSFPSHVPGKHEGKLKVLCGRRAPKSRGTLYMAAS